MRKENLGMSEKTLVYDIDQNYLTVAQDGDIIFHREHGQYTSFDILKLLRELGYELEKY
jgi:hypothetical protein